jgi:mono/diheme cytochrome c family protein
VASSIVRLSLVAATLAASVGCYQRTYEVDRAEIQERYRYQYEGECSSWLKSSKTGMFYCASPEIVLEMEPVLDLGPAEEEEAPAGAQKTDKASLMAKGEEVYQTSCVACHGATGAGIPGAFPPLAGAGDAMGDAVTHATIIKKGLMGEIVVLGTTYNGVMPPQALSDYEIAAVATFERNSWGNDHGIVTPDDVAKVK